MFIRPSQWSFITSGSGGLNIDVLALTGGEVQLDDPKGSLVKLHYGSAGAGLGLGLKLPKVGKLEIKPERLGKAITGTVAPTSAPNTGHVYMTDFFKEPELTKDDLSGICLIVDGGGGLIVGYSVTVMLLGIDPARFAAQMTSPILSLFIGQAEPKAAMLIRGWNAGLQGGGGIAAYVGYMG